MEHPKFIITSGGHLRLGMVTMHRDLLMPHEDCMGGGVYEFDYVGNRVILSGKSYDYGSPRWSKIEVLLVPESLKGMTVIYRDSRGEELDINGSFRISYY